MATRNIVPRANEEGNIGTSAKNWLSGFFKTLNIWGEAIMKQITTPSNPSTGYNKLYFKSDGKLYKLSSAGVEAEIGAGTGTVVKYRGTFVNADLTAGILTVTHNLNVDTVSVVVKDNNGEQVLPGLVDETSNNAVTIDLSAFGTLTGTWEYLITG